MLQSELKKVISQSISDLYKISDVELKLEKTEKNHSGDYTIVVFPLLRYSKKKPEDTANELGEHLKKHCNDIEAFNVIKGFLNLNIKDSSLFKAVATHTLEVKNTVTSPKSPFLIEFSSPNTNKPLHLGHIRNNLLGHSVSQILKECGHNVKTIQIINDRGIHICKSMLAWKLFGNNETPESTKMKGDHFVGKYYVEYEKHYQAELQQLQSQGMSKEQAEKASSLNQKSQRMLQEWEKKDKDTIELWKKMNQWVYEGFEQTYARLGVNFDKNYYESNTYILGKEAIEEGLKKGVFIKKPDQSVWIDLTEEGLDEKLLLRSDGTSVYMTQDIGTAIDRYKDFHFSDMIYTVADEQNYHFQVLFLILKKLGYQWAKHCYHLSYGMVNLPSGKMKSREGTVVDADALMDQMEKTASALRKEKRPDFKKTENHNLDKIIGMAALKFHILKVDSKKTVLFDPKESIDFHGKTGPFIQYTHARIKSILKKYNQPAKFPSTSSLSSIERALIKKAIDYQNQLSTAATNHSPSVLANYLYDLVKTYNTYYQETPILQDKNPNNVHFRVALSAHIATIIKKSANLLGFEVPEEM